VIMVTNRSPLSLLMSQAARASCARGQKDDTEDGLAADRVNDLLQDHSNEQITVVDVGS